MDLLKAAYVIDEAQWEKTNGEGKTYWWAYIEEILDRIGLTAEKVHAADLPTKLHDFSTLFIGNIDASSLASNLDAWVRNGGTLFACGTSGLDGICGNRFIRQIPQSNDEFSITGELHLTKGIHKEIRFPIYVGKPLLLAGAIRLVNAESSTVIATTQNHAVITSQKYGDGWAFYFGFDLAKTFWVIQQGRPVDSDYDGDGYLRTGDALVTGDYEPEIPYTDELMILLERFVGLSGIPLIHRLPPVNDKIPDVLLFYGGDDEGSTGVQIPAAEFMASRKLPYHINCMLLDGKYGLNPGEIRRLDELGTELAPHFDFINGFAHPTGFSREDVLTQTKAFIKHFNRQPFTSNCHWCRWTSYHEPALWLSEAGIRGDNSFVHRRLDVLNPTNTIGFAFGTAFPFNIYANHAYGNRRTGVVELPITAYEVGYTAGGTDFPTLERALKLAIHYGSTMNFFYHPVYISQQKTCRNAIDRLLSLIKEWGITPVHSTPDALAKWWIDRNDSQIKDIRKTDGKETFTIQTPSELGCIVKLRYFGAPPSISLPYRTIKLDKQSSWLMIAVPPGETRVEIKFE
ncbi:MAG: hypothetical protein QHH26_00765 [Armatimonadota bacterium]|nr:hypothetical protein [Armatimonadota bacterium]